MTRGGCLATTSWAASFNDSETVLPCLPAWLAYRPSLGPVDDWASLRSASSCDRAFTVRWIASWTCPSSDAGSGDAGVNPPHAAMRSSGVSAHAGTDGWSPVVSAIDVANDWLPRSAGDGTGPMLIAASGSSNPTVPSRYRPIHPLPSPVPGVPVHQ